MRLLLLPLLLVLAALTAFGQSAPDSVQLPPSWRTHFRTDTTSQVAAPSLATVFQTAHNQGNMQISLSNSGRFGVARVPDYPHIPVDDPLTGEPIQRCTYPRGENHVFMLDSYFWVGAVRGSDTAVCDEEWMTDKSEYNPFGYESTSRAQPSLYRSWAHSDLDILCAYTDTTRNRDQVGSNYVPTMLKVTQRSMAWGGAGADDFVLVECELQNLGSSYLRNIWCGVTFNNEVRNTDEVANRDQTYEKFLCGFLPYDVVSRKCVSPQRLDIGYVMSADARPYIKQWTKQSALAAVGARWIAMPGDTFQTNFNWETYLDNGWFSPRLRGTPNDPFRSYNYWGPWNNRGQLYHLLRHKEVDYDQMFTAVNHYWEGWQLPPPFANEMANGLFAWATVSAGGFDLAPGATAKVVYTIVAGDSVHTHPLDYENLFTPDDPDAFYHSLNFGALTSNARWAERIYDNPGFDTDGDGYAGEFQLCGNDTIWISGDGVPDFRADSPPPAPDFRVIPQEGKLTVRWNGFLSETTPDPFTRVVDFEGYNVYLGLDTRPSSLTLYRSWDKPNFVRYQLVEYAVGQFDWRATDIPLSLDSLRRYYNNPEFDPNLYDRQHPLEISGSYYYFAPQGYNASAFTPYGVHRVYPDAVRPSNDSLLWTDDEVTTEHGRRLPKFYEYEFTIVGLMPTIEYFVNVTANDFGYALSGLAGQESSKGENILNAWAMPLPAQTQADRAVVYTWPNPYRFDGNYEADGYENRKQELWRDRAHLIHFANLPAKCTISIFTLDGDLVQTIPHNFPPDDPEASHASWDLVTRNIQLATSGIYYFVVESASGNQIGKFVIIE